MNSVMRVTISNFKISGFMNHDSFMTSRVAKNNTTIHVKKKKKKKSAAGKTGVGTFLGAAMKYPSKTNLNMITQSDVTFILRRPDGTCPCTNKFQVFSLVSQI